MQAESNRFLELFRPNRIADSVVAVAPAELSDLGIDALLLDLDNTLVPWHGYDVSDAVLRWLREVEMQGIKLCIVSNTLYPGRLECLADQLQVPFVKGRLKPRKSAFRPALELLNATPDRAAVIGDQMFTDILGGNRLGLYTILVKPLGRREFFGTKISRVFERVILRALAASPVGVAESRNPSLAKSPVVGAGAQLAPQQLENPGTREQSPDAGSQSKAEQ